MTVSSLLFSRYVKSGLTLHLHRLQHTRLFYPQPSPRVFSNSCPLSQWCYINISPAASPFSFCLQLQSSPESGSFPMSQLFTSGGQSIGALASETSILLMNIQSWFPLRLTGLISLKYKLTVSTILLINSKDIGFYWARISVLNHFKTLELLLLFFFSLGILGGDSLGDAGLVYPSQLFPN